MDEVVKHPLERPSESVVEWMVVDTAGTVYGPIVDEATARKLAEPIRRQLFSRTVKRSKWSEIPAR